jgi:hypothetical protein
MMHTEMTDEYRNAIYSKYNIVSHTSFLNFDQDILSLEDYLLKSKKDSFNHNDRIIVEHMDTDYYIPDFPYGVTLYNLIKAFVRLDIPLFTLLLFTNHFGIEKEVLELLPNQEDKPTFIYSFISKGHYSGQYTDHDIDSNSIEIPALSMMAAGRVHRDVISNFLLKNNLLDVVATCYHRI